MSQLLYQFYIFILGPILSLAALFNNKAKLAYKGRANAYSSLVDFKVSLSKAPIWFHVSSLGELEQAYPLIEKLKAQGERIIVSFFSPSGYTKHKSYAAIDFAFYLPIDTVDNAVKTLEIIKPKICIWVKYDFWFNHLKEINKQEIPLFLIAAKFDQKHFLFSGILKGLKNKLSYFDHIFAQDKATLNLLQSTGFKAISLAGDPRIDRVMQRKVKHDLVKSLKEFKSDKRLVCFASIHSESFKLVADFINTNPQYKYLVAPHEIDQLTVNKLVKHLDNYLLYTDPDLHDSKNKSSIVLNTIGDLFSSYSLADAIYVGGGFGGGIHNILEPAIFNKPIVIGPNYSNFKEALDLTQRDLVRVIKIQDQLGNALREILNTDTDKIEAGLNTYFAKAQGATALILDFINQKRYQSS